MTNLISERKNNIEKIQINNIEILNSNENAYMRSPKSKICFAILVHEKRELVKQLINNVRHFCLTVQSSYTMEDLIGRFVKV
ncbi:hypothetical protein KEH51_25355 [[Brevibacterium] frigoritolerans]|uniref:Uncharacterized protein n=1 Tax=Peribacillus frigoritolerans TaxID=450367 RepID=A0A941FJV8_9BACI|nr:hypothetical protein [Peribacillus frigoritolerans]